MKIELKEGKAYIYTPYNKDFVKAIRNIGSSRWNGAAWVVDERDVDIVREHMRNIYGEDDLASVKKVTVKVHINESYHVDRDSFNLFGKTIARATGRDSGAYTGDGVSLIDGQIASGGSVKNWHTYVESGTEFRIYDVPEHLIPFAVEEEGDRITITIEEPKKKLASLKDIRSQLRAEKKELRKRMEEVEKKLAEIQMQIDAEKAEKED